MTQPIVFSGIGRRVFNPWFLRTSRYETALVCKGHFYIFAPLLYAITQLSMVQYYEICDDS